MYSFAERKLRSIVRMVGRESLDLLQRISTNNVANLELGGHRRTVLTNEKGRIVEIVNVLAINSDQILLIAEGNDPAKLLQWLQKFVIMEDITLSDESDSYGIFRVLWNAEVETTFPGESGSFGSFSYENCDTFTIAHTVHGQEVIDVLVPAPRLEPIRSDLHQLANEVTSEQFEELRIRVGIPGYPGEFNEKYNPLEAGLTDLISFTKGCYIGQEVIARLDAQGKIQRSLRSVSVSRTSVPVPTPLMRGSTEVGMLTSIAGTTGLAYIKTENAIAGISLECFDANLLSTKVSVL